jgi:hypothetical protein
MTRPNGTKTYSRWFIRRGGTPLVDFDIRNISRIAHVFLSRETKHNIKE